MRKHLIEAWYRVLKCLFILHNFVNRDRLLKDLQILKLSKDGEKIFGRKEKTHNMLCCIKQIRYRCHESIYDICHIESAIPLIAWKEMK